MRTLHYYDSIGLLTPPQVGKNGYRYYDDPSLLRLQQILFYREIGLELNQIQDILDSPNFDLLLALQSHRTVLREKIARLEALVNTVDTTIMHLAGEIKMSDKKMFQAFSEDKQKDYERRARLQYGPEKVNESVKRWKSYTEAEKAKVFQEGNAIYSDLIAAIDAGQAPESVEVQTILIRWHDHLRYFYEPTLEILRGLGELYNTEPEFIANFKAMHPDLPAFIQNAVTVYVDALENTEIERLLAEDENNRRQG